LLLESHGGRVTSIILTIAPFLARAKKDATDMEPNFRADEFSRLTPLERVSWCRQMALEADRLADQASLRVRSAYAELAKQWTALADEIEREVGRRM
jgi:hypothetical protein